eukprot:363712-Chlamydomonas_euryale.AAC.14
MDTPHLDGLDCEVHVGSESCVVAAGRRERQPGSKCGKQAMLKMARHIDACSCVLCVGVEASHALCGGGVAHTCFTLTRCSRGSSAQASATPSSQQLRTPIYSSPRGCRLQKSSTHRCVPWLTAEMPVCHHHRTLWQQQLRVPVKGVWKTHGLPVCSSPLMPWQTSMMGTSSGPHPGASQLHHQSSPTVPPSSANKICAFRRGCTAASCESLLR